MTCTFYLQPQDERQDSRTGRPCGTGTPQSSQTGEGEEQTHR